MKQYITLPDYLTHYLKGKPVSDAHTRELTDELKENARVLLRRVNSALSAMAVDIGEPECIPGTSSIVTSGWRPRSYNKTIPGAALRSNHIECLAVDLFDPEGVIDGWFSVKGRLAEHMLYAEHRSATKGWCHLQSVPPRSGNRIFYP